ncbi:hypothetical protein EG329_011998 [Mollisiaceae sp. DMI_Dod_QoI]|nr:hypothetical protein EG329_011998 [Helotiales sp. DMI_Dod_QoI]
MSSSLFNHENVETMNSALFRHCEALQRFDLQDPALIDATESICQNAPYQGVEPIHPNNPAEVLKWEAMMSNLSNLYPPEVIRSDRLQRSMYYLDMLKIGPDPDNRSHGIPWLSIFQQTLEDAEATAIAYNANNTGYGPQGDSLEQEVYNGSNSNPFVGNNWYEVAEADDRGDNDGQDKKGRDATKQKTAKKDHTQAYMPGSQSRPPSDNVATAPAPAPAANSTIRWGLARCTECIRRKKVCTRVDGNGPCDRCRNSRTPRACVPEAQKDGPNPFYGWDKSKQKENMA